MLFFLGTNMSGFVYFSKTLIKNLILLSGTFKMHSLNGAEGLRTIFDSKQIEKQWVLVCKKIQTHTGRDINSLRSWVFKTLQMSSVWTYSTFIILVLLKRSFNTIRLVCFDMQVIYNIVTKETSNFLGKITQALSLWNYLGCTENLQAMVKSLKRIF